MLKSDLSFCPFSKSPLPVNLSIIVKNLSMLTISTQWFWVGDILACHPGSGAEGPEYPCPAEEYSDAGLYGEDGLPRFRPLVSYLTSNSTGRTACLSSVLW
jgi:hypothetical protein